MSIPPSIEERIAHLEGSYEQIERRLSTLEQDLRSLRAFISARFDRLDSRMDRLDSRMDRFIYWQLGLMAAIAASILATVLTRLLSHCGPAPTAWPSLEFGGAIYYT